MELQQLRYFIAVAEHMHFTKAAEHLHVSQPHLSRAVRALEDELDIVLFQRSTRRIHLTEAGTVFLHQLRHVFDDLDGACRSARAVHTGYRGRLRLGFVGSVTYSWLPRLVRRFRSAYPDVDVDIRSEMLTGWQAEALRADRLDAGVLRTPVQDPDLHTATLAVEPMVLALPANHPLASADTAVPVTALRDERFINYSDTLSSATHRVVLATCLDAGFAPRTTQAVADTHTLVSLVAAGIGVALVPAATQHFAVTGVEYRQLANRPPSIELAVAWLGELEGRPILANFIRLATGDGQVANARHPPGHRGGGSPRPPDGVT